MVTLDNTKALDTVCHKRLFIKLDYYGIRRITVKLIQFYLNYRLQYVYIDNIGSNQTSFKLDVPQGSVFGPFLFLIHICYSKFRTRFTFVSVNSRFVIQHCKFDLPLTIAAEMFLFSYKFKFNY